MHLTAVKETQQDKVLVFVIYSYSKDCAFTAVKRDARVKFLTGYVKGIPSFNRRCTKRMPFLSKMVHKRVSRWTDLRVEPPVYNSLDYPSPPRQVSLPAARNKPHKCIITRVSVYGVSLLEKWLFTTFIFFCLKTKIFGEKKIFGE